MVFSKLPTGYGGETPSLKDEVFLKHRNAAIGQNLFLNTEKNPSSHLLWNGSISQESAFVVAMVGPKLK